ncbi:MAG: SUMF1/EgtB/PvdO family nonheme iron enzyme [Candidatus Competibacter sp.]
MSWYRIDEQREISADFITGAEYQLFLDEKRVQGEYCQPDHWNDEQFPKGQAQEPILGVRGQDASQFCKWLSQRQGNKFHYRLPAPEEISNHPATVEKEIGCWCAVGEKRFVCGLNLSQWKEFFLNALNSDWSHILTALALALALARDRAVDRARDLARAVDRALAIDFDLDLARAVDRALALDHARDHALALDRDHALALDRDHALARPFTSKDLSALRSLCCTSIFLWALDHYSNPKPAWYKRLWSKRTEIDVTRGIPQGLDAALNLYAFFLLIDERRKGNLPAWEGIRIVRERLE